MFGNRLSNKLGQTLKHDLRTGFPSRGHQGPAQASRSSCNWPGDDEPTGAHDSTGESSSHQANPVTKMRTLGSVCL